MPTNGMLLNAFLSFGYEHKWLQVSRVAITSHMPNSRAEIRTYLTPCGILVRALINIAGTGESETGVVTSLATLMNISPLTGNPTKV